MIEPQPSNRFKGALLRTRTALANGWSRTSAYVRRHPWRTALAVPGLLVLYVAVLYPFTPSIGDIKKAKLEQPTVVLSADGKELAVFKRANRDWVKLSDISPHVVNALVATEDHRFYKHHGFDAKRTLKAAFSTVGGDRQGGSTITQQLARNLYPEEVGREVSITRKVKELITAFKIEAIYSKKEILETYLNTVPFLYNAYGIEMAARTYFDKSADKLDIAEAATLVGMLKGTSYYNPVLAPERAVTRRNTVLNQMVKHNKLTQAQFETLARKPLKIDFERQPEFGGPAPHLAQNIKRWLIDWADRKDYNIYADGLRVRTSIDSTLQTIANEAVVKQGKLLQAVADVEWGRAGGGLSTDPSSYASQQGKVEPFSHFWASQKGLLQIFLRESDAYRAARAEGLDDAAALAKLQGDAEFMAAFKRDKTRLQAGFMAVDPMSGHVKAWVGSRDYQEDKFDHVAQARRQPGSTFKPFVYGAAFEAGARPTDTYMDQPVEIRIDRNQVWKPTDLHGSTNAPMTLRDGLSKSKNTITVQVLQQVGPSRVARLARAMGVRQSPLQEVPSLALGTSPVTLREMVTGYATIANSGHYIEPIVVTSIEDRSGRVLETFTTMAPERAMTPEAAHTLLDVLRGAIDEGTAIGMRPRFGIPADVDLAGKTGTTQNNTDGWFVLMHPQLVAGAWVGFNDNRVTMRSEYWGQGAHNALFIVGDFTKQALAARAVDAKMKFPVPKDSSKGEPGSIWDPLVGRVNDIWNSLFPSNNETAAVPQATPVPPMPKVPSMPEPAVVAEPLRLPDSGALPPMGRSPETAVLGAPPPRTPDAVIAAPPTVPPVYTPEVARVIPGGRARTPQSIEIAPSSTPPGSGSTPSPATGTASIKERVVSDPPSSTSVVVPSLPRSEVRESVTPAPAPERPAPQSVPSSSGSPSSSSTPSIPQASGEARTSGSSSGGSSSSSSSSTPPSAATGSATGAVSSTD